MHTDGSPAPEAYGRTFNGFTTGAGNPTDPWGIELSVVKAGMGNTYALVRVNPAD